MNDFEAVHNQGQLSSKIDCIQQNFTNQCALFAKLDQQSLLITPNQRTMRLISQDFNQYQQSMGKVSWEPLQAMPYEVLINTLLQSELGEQAHCLTPMQAHSLWLDCVQQLMKSSHRQHHGSLATLAQSAWHLLKTWQIPTHQLKNHHNKDVLFFDACVKDFTRSLRRNQWITPAEAADWLSSRKPTATARLTKRWVFYGFDQLTPSMLSLMETMQSVGYEIIWAECTASQAKVRLHSYGSQAQEIEAMLQWMLKTAKAFPTKRLLAVVPSLMTMRPVIEKMIHQYKQQDPGLEINVSGGEPLSGHPIIQHAFLIIQWCATKQLHSSSISLLLRSPFVQGGLSELSPRSLLDDLIRSQHRTHWSVQSLNRLCEPFDVPCFRGLLSSINEAERIAKLSPSAWVLQCKAWLQQMGWPGDRSLNSKEHQLHKAFEDALASMTELDLLHASLGFDAMFRRLKHACQQHLFQIETPNANCHILGALEAASIACDELWVMDCSYHQWPKPAQPHPFLPTELQKKFQTPHASAEKEYAFSWQILSRLLQNTTQAHLSFATMVDDTEQLPSQLVERLCQQSFPEACGNPSSTTPFTNALETIVDQRIIPLEESCEHVNTSLFKQQAACPFSAVANHRLMATDLSSAEPYLSPADIGIMVHDALRRFWGNHASQADLLSLSDEQLSRCIRDVVQQSMRGAMKQSPFNRDLQASLAQYLEGLIQRVLKADRERPPFKVVACETPLEAPVLSMQLHGVIDRIDQFADGRYALIDYKTGQANINEWFNDRLTQPQLPLYACLHKWSFDAVMFVLIQPHQVKYSGLIAKQANLPALERIDESWSALKRRWRQQINALANEWLSGRAAVEPA